MPKFVRKNAQRIDHNNFNHIRSLIVGRINIDVVLADASREVFPLEEKTLFVLQKISENTSIHEYAIGKINAGYCDRFAVGRRLPFLLDNELIRTRHSEEFRNTGKQVNSFSCTLKGIVATLQSNKFEEMKIVIEYFDEIREIVKNYPILIDLSILYAKYQIAIELLWAKINKLNYTESDEFNEVFFEEVTNHHIQIGILRRANDDDLSNYEYVLERYWALKHIVFLYIKKIYRKILPKIYLNKDLEHIIKSLEDKGQDPVKSFLARYLLKDWGFYLDLKSFIDKPKQFALIDYGSYNRKKISLEGIDSETEFLYDSVRKELGLRKSHVPILSEIRYGRK